MPFDNKNQPSRRTVLKGMAAVSLAQILSACGGGGDDGDDSYGPLSAHNGSIALPDGFRYVELAPAGSLMNDGRTMPGAHDGMTCFAAPDGTLLLLRNHELSSNDAPVGDTRYYDSLGAGGVTVTVFDPASEKAVKNFAALLGTIENCNGGTSLSGAWLSCEETTEGIGAGFTRPHGYVFEVPATTTALIATPLPLKAMGRFAHEAARQDPTTGVVYMTEDNGDPADGFYRFVPVDKMDLSRGGRLQMLAVKGQPQAVLYRGQTVGADYATAWVDIADPDPSDAETEPAAVFLQGLALGGAQFMGLEGMALQNGVAYFVGSEAGDKELGQVWSFTPDGDGGTLKLLYESTDGSVLDQPDNITVSPNGAVVMCEDGDGEDEGGDNWLRVLTPNGKVFDFARNIKPIDLNLVDSEDYPEPGKSFGVSEFSGVCFSPDGRWMFLNVQYPGLTLAITGPWERGVL